MNYYEDNVLGQYKNAAQGLKYKFVAELVAIACSVIMIVPLLGTVLGMYGMIACNIVSILGLYLISRDIPGCKIAFIVTIISIVFDVARIISGNLWLMSVVSNGLSFLALFYVCKSLAEDLRDHGMLENADRAELVWKINLVCTAISIIISVMMFIPLINLLGIALGFINSLAEIVGGVLYFIFLYKSYKFYEAY